MNPFRGIFNPIFLRSFLSMSSQVSTAETLFNSRLTRSDCDCRRIREIHPWNKVSFFLSHSLVNWFKNRVSFSLYSGAISESVKIFLNESHNGLIEIIPKEVVFNTSITSVYGIIKGISPGHVEITAQPNTTEYVLCNHLIFRLFTYIRFVDFSNIYLICLISFRVTDTFIRVLVANSRDLITFSNIIGWLYFVAWSVSFYPQIYINFRRKSVIGLNFDFLSLNIVGFILYGVFNIGLYSIPQIQVRIPFFHCNFFLHFFNSKPLRKI